MIQETVKVWRTAVIRLDDGYLSFVHPEEISIPLSEYNIFMWDRINRFDVGNKTVFVSKNKEQLDAFWLGWTFRYEIAKDSVLKTHNN